MARTNMPASLEDAALLHAFLEGNRTAEAPFLERLRKLMYPTLRRSGWDLDREMAEEVLTAACIELHRRGPCAFDPTRCSAKQFIGWALKTAIRQVREGYTPPGERTQIRASSLGSPVLGEEDSVRRRQSALSLDAAWNREDAESSSTLSEHTPYPQALGDLVLVEDRVYAEELLREARLTAPHHVASALELIYFEGCSLRGAARLLDIDHTTLGRNINAWAKTLTHYIP